MIPGRLAYLRPTTPAEAWQALADDPAGSTVLSGGTWVVPELHQGLRTARRVIDLRGAGLGGVHDEGDTIHMGATATYADVLESPVMTRRLPLLAAMAAAVTGGGALHNQATIGGSLCAARPTSDAPAAVVTAGAIVHVEGPRGPRQVPAADFVVGRGHTALEPDELLVGLSFPPHDHSGTGYRKIKRGTSSWPVVTASAVVELAPDGSIATARWTVGAIHTTPLPLPTDDLVGHRPDDARWADAVTAALDVLAEVSEPHDDELASGRYRLAVAPVAARDALDRALHTAPSPLRTGAPR